MCTHACPRLSFNYDYDIYELSCECSLILIYFFGCHVSWFFLHTYVLKYMSNRFNINTCSATFEFLFTIYVCNNDFKYIASLELSVPERYSMHMINPYNKFWKVGGYFLIHSTPVFSIGLWWDTCCSYVLCCAVVFVFVLCLVLNVVLVCGLTTRFLSCAQCCPSIWIDHSVSLTSILC